MAVKNERVDADKNVLFVVTKSYQSEITDIDVAITQTNIIRKHHE